MLAVEEERLIDIVQQFEVRHESFVLVTDVEPSLHKHIVVIIFVQV